MLKACLIFLALPILVLLGVGAFVGLALFGTTSTTSEFDVDEPPSIVITAVPYMAPTEVPPTFYPTLPPTWTPSPFATNEPTAQPSATLTPSATLVLPSPTALP